MVTINFQENMPKFGTFKNKTIGTQKPSKIFSEKEISKNGTMLNIKCSCGDSKCKNSITFFYDGLNCYTSSKNIGNDKQINILPCHKENNITWNPAEENVAEFVSFYKTVREAILFKQKLLDRLYAELLVRIKDYGEIQIIVRKEKFETLFILFEIPKNFPKVALYSEAPSYRECLGIIGVLPTNIDTSKIKNGYADMRNPFFEPIIKWVEILGKENQLTLEIQNIWVMPE